jgi:hypothetical protein
MRDTTGNLPLLPGIFPDYAAPIVRNAPDGVRDVLRNAAEKLKDNENLARPIQNQDAVTSQGIVRTALYGARRTWSAANGTTTS